MRTSITCAAYHERRFPLPKITGHCRDAAAESTMVFGNDPHTDLQAASCYSDAGFEIVAPVAAFCEIAA